MGTHATLARILKRKPIQVLIAFVAVGVFIVLCRFNGLELLFRIFSGTALAAFVFALIRDLLSGEARRRFVVVRTRPFRAALSALTIAFAVVYFGAMTYFGPQRTLDAIPGSVRALITFVILAVSISSMLNGRRRDDTAEGS